MDHMIGNPENCGWILLQPVDQHDQELLPAEAEWIRKLCPKSSFAIVPFSVDWFTGLTPWSAPSPFRGQPDFGCGAEDTLKHLLEHDLPALRRTSPSSIQFILGGYSLAGLFALWAGTRTDAFTGIAAASPSVWYPGWMEYIRQSRILAPMVYLSLGDREERTKNPEMRTVGAHIREQYEMLQTQRVRSLLEWNPGNHFVDSEKRMAAGFAWIMNQDSGQP